MAKIELMVPVKALAGKAQELREQINLLLQPTRLEQGCEFYRAYESEIEGHFFFHELWTSQEDLDRHVRSPHIQIFAKALYSLLAEPLELNKVSELE
jgi:quinol monooxygenase YgiN